MSRLKIKGLSKTYSNGVQALNNISLDIPTGMFGLLGPNGAGKSTLMRTIATLQEADEGTVFFNHIDVLKNKNDIRNILGYLPQDFGLYPRINALELLNHLAILKGLTDRKVRKDVVTALLHKTNLYSYRKRNLGTYSGGMKKRFGVAQALLTSPELLIVDEPTAGLDPTERNRFHNLLCEIAEKTVVILSTHIVEDVKELCNNMAIIQGGKVLFKGSPDQAIQGIQGNVYSKTIDRVELNKYRREYNVISERLHLGKPIIHVHHDLRPDHTFTPVTADLSDVYFSKVVTPGI